jgi:hypothetical protein
MFWNKCIKIRQTYSRCLFFSLNDRIGKGKRWECMDGYFLCLKIFLLCQLDVHPGKKIKLFRLIVFGEKFRLCGHFYLSKVDFCHSRCNARACFTVFSKRAHSCVFLYYFLIYFPLNVHLILIQSCIENLNDKEHYISFLTQNKFMWIRKVVICMIYYLHLFIWIDHETGHGNTTIPIYVLIMF